ncbi:hypothetical protein [Shewanella algae]|uniref:hypothetical protein n=1 Tax=Shewanella algae TaxID=38313 RepID=UPI001BEF7FB0|nr:hypothetical protein [Shewanella algae]BCV54690.1 hypothetical protein TUM17383_29370 [Shewanella algae]
MQNLFQLWPESLLFERKTLRDISDEDIQGLIEKAYMPGLLNHRVTNVTAILCLLYDARKSDPDQYLNKVFLPWVYLKNRTSVYRQRILKEISRHKEFDENTEEDILHAVNLYRNIISELFDPLLTLLYASYKFINGEISDLFEVDLHAGERQKYEYVSSRLKCETLFSGYDPEVRNAVSHTGGNGMSIKEGVIEFRSVKRGNPPKVKLIKWSYDELFMHMIELLEFVSSIDICSDIFGIDSLDIISSKFNTLNQMIYYAMSEEQQSEIIKKSDLQLEKIRSSENIDHSKKLELLAYVLTKECKKREIALPLSRYIKEDDLLITKIDRGISQPTDDQDIIAAATYLIRYSILARTIFGKLMTNYAAQEEYSNKSMITAKFTGATLDKYITKQAGVVDLLNDGDFYENGKPLEIAVDFNALESIEEQRVGKPFPRMQR